MVEPARSRPGKTAWLALIALTLFGCGSDTTTTSPAVPVPAEPPAQPVAPPAPPVHRAQVWVISVPGNTGGYVEGETIRLVADFEQPVSVTGSPRLAIEIGQTVRHAAFSPWVEDDFPPERLSLRQRFDYLVSAEDRDEDGISVAADAFDFAEGCS